MDIPTSCCFSIITLLQCPSWKSRLYLIIFYWFKRFSLATRLGWTILSFLFCSLPASSSSFHPCWWRFTFLWPSATCSIKFLLVMKLHFMEWGLEEVGLVKWPSWSKLKVSYPSKMIINIRALNNDVMVALTG